MNIAKRILFVIIGLIAIFLIVGLFLKKEYHVEREIVINKSVSEVFDFIKYLKNQDSYSVWAQRDPNMKKELKGIDGTIGCISSWDSKMDSVGTGEMEIKNLISNQRIDYELRFSKPFQCKGQAYLSTDILSQSQTKVKWVYDGEMPYPMNWMLVFINMDKELGGDLQKGLENLKVILEK